LGRLLSRHANLVMLWEGEGVKGVDVVCFEGDGIAVLDLGAPDILG